MSYALPFYTPLRFKRSTLTGLCRTSPTGTCSQVTGHKIDFMIVLSFARPGRYVPFLQGRRALSCASCDSFLLSPFSFPLIFFSCGCHLALNSLDSLLFHRRNRSRNGLVRPSGHGVKPARRRLWSNVFDVQIHQQSSLHRGPPKRTIFLSPCSARGMNPVLAVPPLEAWPMLALSCLWLVGLEVVFFK
jgi:hypothetical protein